MLADGFFDNPLSEALQQEGWFRDPPLVVWIVVGAILSVTLFHAFDSFIGVLLGVGAALTINVLWSFLYGFVSIVISTGVFLGVIFFLFYLLYIMIE